MFKSFVIALGALSLIPTAAAAQGNGLADRVAALEAQVETLTQRLTALTQPMAVTVDCGAGERLQPALNAVQRHPTLVTVTLFGVCQERIVINRSDLVIRAGATGAGIVSSAPGPAVTVAPIAVARVVSLEGLTVSGGSPGLQVDHGSQVRILNGHLHNSQFGIIANNRSVVRLDNTIVENHTGAGIFATTGSHIVVTGGAVSNNQGNGMSVQSGSMAVIGGSAQIASNLTWGIGLDDGSSLQLGAATVTQNGVTGVFASGGSRVYLNAGATITANGGSGISLMDTSLAQKFRAIADIQITNNGAYGIVCSVPPAVAQVVGFTFQQGNVSGNALGQIDCPISPGPKAQ